MPFICFIGCDGSGKSAVINKFVAHLEGLDINLTKGHWRPSFRQNPNHSADTSNPHYQKARGFTGSTLKLIWLWCNWWIGLSSIKLKGGSNHLIIFDRYHADLLIDPTRYRYGGPIWLARMASAAMPQPDMVFYLDAPTEVLLERKQEIDRETLQQLRDKYLKLCTQNDGITIIDATQPLEDVTRAILEKVKPLMPSQAL